ncbi:aspartate-semialdehyde dehydrogenase [Rickettsiales bacterium LUAb2]
MKKYNVVVIGATGNVGSEMLNILIERNFPIENLYAVASENSKGEQIELENGEKLTVHSLKDFDFNNIDIVLASAGAEISKQYIPEIAKTGAVVIDNSSYFRTDPSIPLIIPEVNEYDIDKYSNKNIIANPNCTTIQMLVALAPLHNIANIKRIVASSYQAVSGAGKDALDELFEQTRRIYSGTFNGDNSEKFPKQLAFNVIPCIDAMLDDLSTKEEWKIGFETAKILDPNIKVSATCVRVPVFNCHSIAVNVEFEHDISIDEVKSQLKALDYIEVLEGATHESYVTPVEVSGSDLVYVSRIRKDESQENTINMWIVADNIRKGAALNAVQIAECLDDIWQNKN